MTRADVLARLRLELDAWVPDHAAITSDDLDILAMALDDALATCTDLIEDAPPVRR